MKQVRKKTLEDIYFILAHVDIDFESQAVWGDEIQVTAWPSKIRTSSFTLTYEASEKRSGRVLARAKSVQVTYDYENKKSKPTPPEFRRLLEGALEGKGTTPFPARSSSRRSCADVGGQQTLPG